MGLFGPSRQEIEAKSKIIVTQSKFPEVMKEIYELVKNGKLKGNAFFALNIFPFPDKTVIIGFLINGTLKKGMKTTINSKETKIQKISQTQQDKIEKEIEEITHVDTAIAVKIELNEKSIYADLKQIKDDLICFE